MEEKPTKRERERGGGVGGRDGWKRGKTKTRIKRTGKRKTRTRRKYER